MKVGNLVRLKTRYPIWLYSQGLADGDLGIIMKIRKEETLIYWLRIRKLGSVKSSLIEVIQQEG